MWRLAAGIHEFRKTDARARLATPRRGYPESPYVLQADIKPMILERRITSSTNDTLGMWEGRSRPYSRRPMLGLLHQGRHCGALARGAGVRELPSGSRGY